MKVKTFYKSNEYSWIKFDTTSEMDGEINKWLVGFKGVIHHVTSTAAGGAFTVTIFYTE